MHSERRYKICTCSVSLGEVESLVFSKLQGLQDFCRKFQMHLNVLRKWIFFWFLCPAQFRFPFLFEKYPNLDIKMWKIKRHKIVGNLLDKLRKLYRWNGHLEILSRPQVIENSRQHLRLRTDSLHKTIVGCPRIFALRTCKPLVNLLFFEHETMTWGKK